MRTAGLPWLGEVEGTSVAMSQVKASPVPAHVPVVRVRYGAVDDEMRALYAGSLRGGSDEDDSTFEGSSAGLGRPQLMPDSYRLQYYAPGADASQVPQPAPPLYIPSPPR